MLPPTTDRDAARTALDQIPLGSGTALGDAIDRSVAAARPNVLPGQAVPKNAIPATVLLLSDGEQTSGTKQPVAAAKQARKLGVPVNTVALGTRDAVVQVPLPNGLKEQVTVTPDPKTLQRDRTHHRRQVRGRADRGAPEAGVSGSRQPDRQEEAGTRGDGRVRRRRRRAPARRVGALAGVDAEAVVKRRLGLALLVVAAAAVAALSAGSAGAADECKGLRVCLPVAGPWVVVPAGGVDYELACPLAGYIVAGTDARVATADVDVSFRGETGSPVGPGVTTHRSVVFHAVRIRPSAGTTSFRPFIGCIPTNGGGGRALTGVTARAAGIKPSRPLFSVVVNAHIESRSQTVRAACPATAQLVGATHAIAFRQADGALGRPTRRDPRHAHRLEVSSSPASPPPMPRARAPSCSFGPSA